MSPKNRYQYALPPHKVVYAKVKVADLKIDPDAQRTLNEKRAQNIADNLVPDAMGPICVSRRLNGDMFVVDGMHRKRVAEIKGITTLAAEIHEGLSQKDEAILFILKNRESAKPSGPDEYRIGLTGEVDLFVDTQAVLDKHKLAIGSTSVNSIGAVNGIVRITENYGASILDDTLTVAEAAWGRNKETWDGMILGGIGMFLGRHGAQVSLPELSKKLAKHGQSYKWVGDVHSAISGAGTHHSGTGSRVTAMYSLVKHEWNKNRAIKNRIA